jgi:hypothetical protein
MSKAVEKRIVYFDKPGPGNTKKALEIALACCQEQGIKKIVVASSSGATALQLHRLSKGSCDIIAVTYCAGSRFQAEVQAFNKNYDALVARGIKIVRGLHALSGAERALENRYKTALMPLNIVADSLRMFSQGVKVCVEITIMAAEHGFVSPREEIVAVGGSGEGADTAVVVKPAYAASMFELKVKELLCMPRA